jgi:hypothetical protein
VVDAGWAMPLRFVRALEGESGLLGGSSPAILFPAVFGFEGGVQTVLRVVVAGFVAGLALLDVAELDVETPLLWGNSPRALLPAVFGFDAETAALAGFPPAAAICGVIGFDAAWIVSDVSGVLNGLLCAGNSPAALLPAVVAAAG